MTRRQGQVHPRTLAAAEPEHQGRGVLVARRVRRALPRRGRGPGPHLACGEGRLPAGVRLRHPHHPQRSALRPDGTLPPPGAWRDRHWSTSRAQESGCSQLPDAHPERTGAPRRFDALVVRKLSRAFLSRRVPLALAHRLVRLVERARPNGGWPLEFLYRAVGGLYVFRGVRRGLRLTSGDSVGARTPGELTPSCDRDATSSAPISVMHFISNSMGTEYFRLIARHTTTPLQDAGGFARPCWWAPGGSPRDRHTHLCAGRRRAAGHIRARSCDSRGGFGATRIDVLAHAPH